MLQLKLSTEQFRIPGEHVLTWLADTFSILHCLSQAFCYVSIILNESDVMITCVFHASPHGVSTILYLHSASCNMGHAK